MSQHTPVAAVTAIGSSKAASVTPPVSASVPAVPDQVATPAPVKAAATPTVLVDTAEVSVSTSSSEPGRSAFVAQYPAPAWPPPDYGPPDRNGDGWVDPPAPTDYGTSRKEIVTPKPAPEPAAEPTPAPQQKAPVEAAATVVQPAKPEPSPRPEPVAPERTAPTASSSVPHTRLRDVSVAAAEPARAPRVDLIA